MGKLHEKFSKKKWKDCCTKLCDECKIASAYIKKYGRKQAEGKIKKDQKKILG